MATVYARIAPVGIDAHPAEADAVQQHSVSVMARSKSYDFDGVFGAGSTQRDVFDTVGARLVINALRQKGSTVLCAGAAGSGKTHTLLGDGGLFARCAEELIDSGASCVSGCALLLRGDGAADLLEPRRCVAVGSLERDQWTEAAAQRVLRNTEDVAPLVAAAQQAQQAHGHVVLVLSLQRDPAAPTVTLKFVEVATNASTGARSSPRRKRFNSDGRSSSAPDSSAPPRRGRLLSGAVGVQDADGGEAASVAALSALVSARSRGGGGGGRGRDAASGSALTRVLNDSIGGRTDCLLIAHLQPELRFWGHTMATITLAQGLRSVVAGSCVRRRSVDLHFAAAAPAPREVPNSIAAAPGAGYVDQRARQLVALKLQRWLQSKPDLVCPHDELLDFAVEKGLELESCEEIHRRFARQRFIRAVGMDLGDVRASARKMARDGVSNPMEWVRGETAAAAAQPSLIGMFDAADDGGLARQSPRLAALAESPAGLEKENSAPTPGCSARKRGRAAADSSDEADEVPTGKASGAASAAGAGAGGASGGYVRRGAAVAGLRHLTLCTTAKLSINDHVKNRFLVLKDGNFRYYKAKQTKAMSKLSTAEAIAAAPKSSKGHLKLTECTKVQLYETKVELHVPAAHSGALIGVKGGVEAVMIIEFDEAAEAAKWMGEITGCAVYWRRDMEPSCAVLSPWKRCRRAKRARSTPRAATTGR